MRKVKTVGGSTKYFIYNGMNIVFEYTESVEDGVTYYYGLNRTHNSNGEIYVYNAHGDVVQLVKDNAVKVSYTYDAFGNLTAQIGESDNPFLYCGEYYDAESKTYYLRARYYDPANGRFTQQDAWAYMDTSDPLSLNLYTYCCNNPVMYIDPSGTSAKDIVAGIVLALDDYVTGGFAKWIVGKFKNRYLDYQYEDEADYYLGRTLGAALGEVIGATSTALGIVEILESIVAGGGITILSDGTATIAGVSVCIEGVALGAAEVGYGVTVMAASRNGIGDEWDNYQSAKSSTSLGNFDKVNDNYLKDNSIDAHQLKKDALGEKAPISEYDIYKNKDTGELYIFKKGGKGAGLPTGEFLK